MFGLVVMGFLFVLGLIWVNRFRGSVSRVRVSSCVIVFFVKMGYFIIVYRVLVYE